MLISKAYAQDVQVPSAADASAPADAAAALASAAPSATEAFLWNMGLVVVMVALFYFLLIQPQQRRFKEHSQMLQGLKKGDKVITGGGLIGTVEKITEGSDEVVVDLGNGLKVTALRATLQSRSAEVLLKGKPANDQKAEKVKADKS